jgi:hypothetical protein
MKLLYFIVLISAIAVAAAREEDSFHLRHLDGKSSKGDDDDYTSSKSGKGRLLDGKSSKGDDDDYTSSKSGKSYDDDYTSSKSGKSYDDDDAPSKSGKSYDDDDDTSTKSGKSN